MIKIEYSRQRWNIKFYNFSVGTWYYSNESVFTCALACFTSSNALEDVFDFLFSDFFPGDIVKLEWYKLHLNKKIEIITFLEKAGISSVGKVY